MHFLFQVNYAGHVIVLNIYTKEVDGGLRKKKNSECVKTPENSELWICSEMPAYVLWESSGHNICPN